MKCDGAAARELGMELRRLRLERGLSLRAMAKKLGMTAHSGLVDYEQGKRVPPGDLMDGYLRELCLADRGLAVLYRRAVIERAEAQRAQTQRNGIDRSVPLAAEPIRLRSVLVLRSAATALDRAATSLNVIADRITEKTQPLTGRAHGLGP